MRKKTLFYLVFGTILLIGFYVMVLYDNPYLSIHPQKKISRVKDFSFVSQYGDTITQHHLKGKIVLAEFFFATCDGICPKMNSAMEKMHQRYAMDNHLLLLSHTVEPEKDNIQALLAYSKRFDLKNKNWLFLTGNKLSLYTQARESYRLDDPNNNVGKIEDQFLHTQFVALVNHNLEVVGIYDILLPSEYENLLKEIDGLLKRISNT